MRVIALCKKCAIMTDDYTVDEILKGTHIEHIKRDIREWNIKGPVTVIDQNDKFVCKLNKKHTA